jgi:hypothetical protein
MVVPAATHPSVALCKSLLIIARPPATLYETFIMVLSPEIQLHSFYVPSIERENIGHCKAIILLGCVLLS